MVTRIRNMTEIRKKRLERMIQFLLVRVARLTSTPGVYVGVRVRSELISVPITPFPCSFVFFCLRAASDRKVGRAML